MEFYFEKYRAMGKNYLIFDTGRNGYSLSSEKVKKILKHHFGAGVDAVIQGDKKKSQAIEVLFRTEDKASKEENNAAVFAYAGYLFDSVETKKNVEIIDGQDHYQICYDQILPYVRETGKVITSEYFIVNL